MKWDPSKHELENMLWKTNLLLEHNNLLLLNIDEKLRKIVVNTSG